MYRTILLAAIFIVGAVSGSSCPSPTITKTKSYTTTDASILTNVAYVGVFDIKCNGAVPAKTDNFYAEVNGKIVNVARSIHDKGFQVSWTEEISKATRGDHYINVYDEDTLPQVRKAKSGEYPKPLGTVIVNHPGAYSGPWLNSEMIAAITGLVVVYVAVTCKNKLLS